jgi:hypothetical protein
MEELMDGTPGLINSAFQGGVITWDITWALALTGSAYYFFNVNVVITGKWSEG